MARYTVTATLLATLQFGCSGYEVNTNLDRENFSDYFKPSQVTVYERQQLQSLNYQRLGTVEGESCQSSQLDPPPSEADARTEARRRAAELGANGLWIDQCLQVEPNKDCIALLVCYGQAIKVAEQ